MGVFLDMGKRIFSDIKSQDKLIPQIIANANKIMPLITVRLKTYVGQTPIEYETNLAAEETMTTTEE